MHMYLSASNFYGEAASPALPLPLPAPCPPLLRTLRTSGARAHLQHGIEQRGEAVRCSDNLHDHHRVRVSRCACACAAVSSSELLSGSLSVSVRAGARARACVRVCERVKEGVRECACVRA